MERIVIVGYRPLPGKEKELVKLIKSHVEILRQENFATDRKSIIMQAKDGTVVEVFGWKSEEAMKTAHSHPRIQKMWEEYSEVCEYVPVAALPEATEIFSEFTPVN